MDFKISGVSRFLYYTQEILFGEKGKDIYLNNAISVIMFLKKGRVRVFN